MKCDDVISHEKFNTIKYLNENTTKMAACTESSQYSNGAFTGSNTKNIM